MLTTIQTFILFLLIYILLVSSSRQLFEMPLILNVDHKTLAMTTLAATASVAAYSLYRVYTLKRQLASREDVCKTTAKSLNEYLVFHYGSSDHIMLWSFGPKSDVDFPKRCSDLCVKHAVVKVHTMLMTGAIESDVHCYSYHYYNFKP